MSWNDGYERKKFMAGMKKQAEEYRTAGMTEEQIKAMYEFDLGVYKSDRTYYSHTQEYEASSFDEGVDDSDNALLNRNADAFSVSYEERYFISTAEEVDHWWWHGLRNYRASIQDMMNCRVSCRWENKPCTM